MEWKGKLIGAGVGLVGGPYGVVFGGLVGHLVDLALDAWKQRKKIRGFVADPLVTNLSSRRDGVFSFYMTGLCIILADRGYRPKELRAGVSFLIALIARRFDLSLREQRLCHWVLEDLVSSEGMLTPLKPEMWSRDVLRRLAESHAEAVLAVQSQESRQQLVEDLYRVAATGLGPIEQKDLLRRIAEVWIIPPEETARLDSILGPDRFNGLDPWEILGINRGAPRSEVKRVYRVLARQFHPDGAASLTDTQQQGLEEAFKRITAAYQACLRELQPR